MRPVEIGSATLYLGDCREIIPTLGPVDAVISDPPYGMNLNPDNSRFSGGNNDSITKRGKGNPNRQRIIGDDKPFDPAHLLIGKDQIIWGWNHFPSALPSGACLVWVKRNDGAFGSFLSDAETAFFSHGRGVYCFRDLSNNAIALERSHPSQKPVSLMKWCLGLLPKAKSVLDPYMGSGTTGVACMEMGREFIGIEIDERHFYTACERIERAISQADMFVELPSEQKQDSLL
jgi:site-specific DNA-methyltransferase (adenine-specific)